MPHARQNTCPYERPYTRPYVRQYTEQYKDIYTGPEGHIQIQYNVPVVLQMRYNSGQHIKNH